ncbi:MAG: hypothetical protein Q7S64_01880 [bacterium]|nr:hypothetical protein [bacterium]
MKPRYITLIIVLVIVIILLLIPRKTKAPTNINRQQNDIRSSTDTATDQTTRDALKADSTQ